METFNLSRSQIKKENDYNRQFSHDKDVVDISNMSFDEISNLSPKTANIIEKHSLEYEKLPGYLPVYYGHKELRLPKYQYPKKLLTEINNAKVIKEFFQTPETLQQNREQALKSLQGFTLSHTDRPKSATIKLRYSSDSGKSSYEERDHSLVPKFDRFVRENAEELSKHPAEKVQEAVKEINPNEDQTLFWDFVSMKAVFDEGYFNANQDKFSDRQKAFIVGKKQFLDNLTNIPEDVLKQNLSAIAIQFLNGFQRKFDLEKIHTMSLVQTPDNWYPERDANKLILDYYKKHSVQ